LSPRFQTTRWSLVLAASGEPGKRSNDALAGLFEGYWYPIYGFVRSQGFAEEDARDLVQAYFTFLLDRDGLKNLDPAAGRFRSFVIVSVRNFLNNERERLRAQKRGGNRTVESLDTLVAEERLSREPSSPGNAERVFERRWAETVVRRARERLEREFDQAGQTERYALLGGLLTGEGGTLPYSEIARRLGMGEAGVKSLVHRMRKRFGVLLRGEVLQTIDRPDDVEHEIRYLLRVLSGEG
jgi:RNA polymerase sigma-70 factor (ECF subfamily)